MVRDYERTLIVGALASSGGHQRRAAAALGILPTTLVEKMKRLGISGRRARRAAAPRSVMHA
jgi:DNA-binding NtrC family response regulator